MKQRELAAKKAREEADLKAARLEQIKNKEHNLSMEQRREEAALERILKLVIKFYLFKPKTKDLFKKLLLCFFPQVSAGGRGEGEGAEGEAASGNVASRRDPPSSDKAAGALCSQHAAGKVQGGQSADGGRAAETSAAH